MVSPKRPSLAKRLFIYTAVIVVAVGGGLAYLSRNGGALSRPGGMGGGGVPNVPAKAWTPSSAHDDEANDGFRVATERTDLRPLAGNREAGGWPMFNGARRDNRSDATGLLEEWPEDGPPLVWTAHGVGIGFSTVAVVDGVAYTMGNKGKSETVMALDAGTGEKIWSTPFAWASKLPNGEGPRGTPSVSGDAVCALGGNGDLVCLDRADGKIRWQKNILKEYGAGLATWGFCESVLVDEGRVVCTPGGEKATLVAFDIATGNELWQSLVPEKDRAGYASAVAAEIAGVRQYIQFTASGTVGVRASDGRFLWRENGASNGNANCSSPLVQGDFVFTASNYGQGGALVKLTPEGDGVAATRVYHTSHMQCHHGDMTIVDGHVYGCNDAILTCLELETGTVKWKNRSVGKGAVTSADGRIYLRGEGGAVALFDADPKAYVECGRFDQPARGDQPAWSHPVVAAGRLFLRDQDVLLCYDVSKPRGE